MRITSKVLRYFVPGTLLGAAGLLWGVYARAAGGPSNGIAYSGVIKNNGVAETATRSVVFTLVDANGAGLSCPSDTRGTLAITAGRFSVTDLFSSCSALGDVLSANPGAKVRIAVEGQTLTPDQPLGAVPFSVQAQAASNATSNVFEIDAATTGTISSVVLQNTAATQTAHVGMETSDSGGGQWSNTNAYALTLNTAGASDIALRTNNVTRMTIHGSAPRVRIGRDSSGLTQSGALHMLDLSDASEEPRIRLNRPTSGNDGYIDFASAGSDRWKLSLPALGDSLVFTDAAGNAALTLAQGGAATFGYPVTLSGGIAGASGASGAAAGTVGEVLTNAVLRSAAVTIPANTATTILSLTLTPGDWMVSAMMNTRTLSTTSVFAMIVHTSPNALATGDTYAVGALNGQCSNYVEGVSIPPANDYTQTISPYHVRVTTNTTLYLNAATNVSDKVNGQITAVRIR